MTVREPPQLSVTCAVYVPAVAPRFTHSRVWLAGHVSWGGVLSTTTIHAEQVSSRSPSLAVSVTRENPEP